MINGKTRSVPLNILSSVFSLFCQAKVGVVKLCHIIWNRIEVLILGAPQTSNQGNTNKQKQRTDNTGRNLLCFFSGREDYIRKIGLVIGFSKTRKIGHSVVCLMAGDT